MNESFAAGCGKVYLVGAGPGDAELITLRGVRCLAAAEVVLYDYLVNPALLEHAPASAERICLGHPHGGRGMFQDEINARMVAAARGGKTVVRLKSGDPNLFGRGGEEAEALSSAGIPFEMVPGVTAACAAASCAVIPLTHRDVASAVAFITGHRREDKPALEFDFPALARFPGTLVFYMGMTSALEWSAELIRGGRPSETPVAVVRRASWPDQQTIRCTLKDVAERIEEHAIRPPAVIVVGEAAGLLIPCPDENGPLPA